MIFEGVILESSFQIMICAVLKKRFWLA